MAAAAAAASAAAPAAVGAPLSTSGPVFSTCTGAERSVYWSDGRVHLIDQQLLPGEFKVIAVADLAGAL